MAQFAKALLPKAHCGVSEELLDYLIENLWKFNEQNLATVGIGLVYSYAQHANLRGHVRHKIHQFERAFYTTCRKRVIYI